jgi:exoribonuclease-2
MLDTPISNVGKIQFNRRKYWLLKYLESRIGEKTPGLVLERRRNSFTVLLTDYMLEYSLPASGLKLKPQDTITMVIQHANARKDSFSVYISY